MNSNFFRFSHNAKRGYVVLEPEIEIDFSGLFDGIFKPPENWQLKNCEGSKLYDIHPLTNTSSFVISEYFLNVLKENEISGWSQYSVEIKDVNEKYYGFFVHGKGGKIIKPKQNKRVFI